jgi:hypothetical protein
MSLYDDAGMISLPTGAAGKDNKLYNIKPVEKLKAEELVTNGTFEDNDSEAAWIKVNSPTISGNQVRLQAAGGASPKRIYQTGVLEGGKTYKLSINVVELKSGKLRIGTGYSSNRITKSTPISTPGNYSFVFLNSSGEDDEDWVFILSDDESSDYDITFDNVSVKEVEQEAKDFQFTRSSNLTATRVGPGGLIEKGRENVFTYSNKFDDSSWLNLNFDALITEASVTGYDGGSDAWELECNTTDATGAAIFKGSLSSVGDKIHTFSVYAKAGTTNYMRLNLSGSGNVVFDLSGDGAVDSETANMIGAIEKIGSSGWHRCSATNKAGATTFTGAYIYVYAQDGSDISTTVGDNIYIQDSQLELGLVATDYMYSGDTTGKAGILEDEPRFDHTGGGCPGLLLESQSINLVTYSEYAGGFTTNGTGTVTDNHSTSPEGVKNAFQLSDSGSSAYYRIEENITVAAENVGDHTLSVFIKKTTGSLSHYAGVQLDATKKYVIVDTTNGTANEHSGIDNENDSFSVEDFSDDYWRVIITNDLASAANYRVALWPAISSNGTTISSSATGSNVFYGFQLEKGTFVTSYIPNHGTSGGATRVRDDVGVLSNSTTDGLTNGYNTTIYCKFKLLADDRSIITGLVNYYPPVTGVQNDPRVLLYTGASSAGTFKARLQYRMGNTGDNDQIIETPGTYNVGDEVKAIARITDYDITLFVNGTKFTFADHPTTATAGRAFKKSISGATLNGLDLTYSTTAAHHEVYEVITFPKALTDDECEDLTTL